MRRTRSLAGERRGRHWLAGALAGMLLAAGSALGVAGGGSAVAAGAGTIGACDEAALRAAVDGGGSYTFSCSGTITLESELTVHSGQHVSLDGSGETVRIDGCAEPCATRLFHVEGGGELALKDLVLEGGSAEGQDGNGGGKGADGQAGGEGESGGDGAKGTPGEAGEDGQGGAIEVADGASVEASEVTFGEDTAKGGKGGDGGDGGDGGQGGTAGESRLFVPLYGGTLIYSECAYPLGAFSPDGAQLEAPGEPWGIEADCASASPDGSKLALSTQNGDGSIVNADGKGGATALPPSLPDAPAGYAAQASQDLALGPGGKRITYLGEDERLHIVELADPSREDTLLASVKPEWVAWSPNGSWIAVYGYEPSNGYAVGLWLVRPDGTGGHELIGCEKGGEGPLAGTSTSDGCWSPSWFPDSKKIAFVGKQGVTHGISETVGNAYVVDVGTKDVAEVAKGEVTDECEQSSGSKTTLFDTVEATRVAVAPDGQRLAVGGSWGGTCEEPFVYPHFYLWMVSAEGVTQLTPSTPAVLASEDGSHGAPPEGAALPQEGVLWPSLGGAGGAGGDGGDGGQGGDGLGGAIFNAGTLTLRDCSFAGDHAEGGDGGGGGGGGAGGQAEHGDGGVGGAAGGGGDGGDAKGGAIYNDSTGSVSVSGGSFGEDEAKAGGGGDGGDAGDGGQSKASDGGTGGDGGDGGDGGKASGGGIVNVGALSVNAAPFDSQTAEGGNGGKGGDGGNGGDADEGDGGDGGDGGNGGEGGGSEGGAVFAQATALSTTLAGVGFAEDEVEEGGQGRDCEASSTSGCGGVEGAPGEGGHGGEPEDDGEGGQQGQQGEDGQGSIPDANVNAVPQFAVTTSELPAATVGVPYQATVAAAGGDLPYSFAIEGALPDGLESAGAVIEGIPTEAGSFPVEALVDDGSDPSLSAGADFTLTVEPASGGAGGGGAGNVGGPGGGTGPGGSAVTGGQGTLGTTASRAVGRAGAAKASAGGAGVSVPLSCAGGSRSSCVLTVQLSVTATIRNGRTTAISSSISTPTARIAASGKRTQGRRKRPHIERKTLILGRKRVTLAAGQHETVVVKLNATGRRLLARHRLLRVALVVTQATGGGRRHTIKRAKIALKAGRARHHGHR